MRLLLYIFLSLFAFEVQAQQAQGWFSAQLPFRKDKWEWHNDFGYRNELSKFSTQQFLYRTGVRHYFSEKLSTALGYAFFDTKVKGIIVNEFGPENRIWQELNLQTSLKHKTSLIQRIRTEERWFSKTSVGDSYFAFRTRYRIAVQKNITDRLEMQLYNEIMYQAVSTKIQFNQNRLGLNAFIKVNKHVQVNLGYTYMTTPQTPLHLVLIGFTKR